MSENEERATAEGALLVPSRTEEIARRWTADLPWPDVTALLRSRPLRRGDRLGRYEILGDIATGGMGTVYAARVVEAHFERVVALKVIHARLTQDERIVQMFLDEARIASFVQHPNVCSVIDFGIHEGVFFLAMEHLAGWQMGAVLEQLIRGGAPPRWPAIAARLASEAAAGLHAAHTARDPRGGALDIVHRDVSPSNLFVTTAGHTKVIDFGVARASGRLQTTGAGSIKGKLAYLPPEQFRADPRIDARADVWALGVVLWEMLALQRLFRRPSDIGEIEAVRSAPIAPPSELRAGDAELDRIVLAALERDPERRTPTAHAMHLALEQYLAGEVVKHGPVDTLAFVQALPATRDVGDLLRTPT